MFKLSSLQLVGVEKEEGLMISWLPDGLMIEISESKLEGLRKQYEEQVAVLKKELEDERKKSGTAPNKDLDNLQFQFMQQSKKLKSELNKKQKKELDVLLCNLEEVCAKQLIKLQKEHEDDLSIQLQALKITLEQVHKGELLHVQNEFEQHHLAVVSSLKKSMAELEERLDQSYSSDEQEQLEVDQLSIDELNKKLSDEHNQLVQKISTVLKSDVQSKIEDLKTIETEHKTDSSKDEVINKAEDIRRTLESQREEFVTLRAQLLKDYEMVLQTRTESMTSSSEEVKKLQEEMEKIQTENQEQIKSLQAVIKNKEESDDIQKKLEKEHAEELKNLRDDYEKRIKNIELSFMDEINILKARNEIPNNSPETVVSTQSKKTTMDEPHVNGIDDIKIPAITISSDDFSTSVNSYTDVDVNSVSALKERLIILESELENKNDELLLYKSSEMKQNNKQSDNTDDHNNSGISNGDDVNTVSTKMSELVIEVEELKQQIEELTYQHEVQLVELREDLEHEHKVEVETMQAESKVQMDVEVKRVRAELTDEHSEAIKNLKEKYESELSEKDNEITSIHEKAISEFKDNLINNDIEIELRNALVQKLRPFTADNSDMSLEQYSIEDDSFTSDQVNRLKKDLETSERKYNDLVEGLKEWNIADEEIAEVVQDKLDMQIELSKNVIREEFDETFKAQQKKFIERHRRMMDSFTEEREAETKKLKDLHTSELETLRNTLTEEYETKIQSMQASQLLQSESSPETIVKEVDDSGVHASVSDSKTSDMISSEELHLLRQELLEKTELIEKITVDRTMKVDETLQEKHELEITKIQKSYEEKLDALQKEFNDKIEAIILDNDTAKSELEEAHKQEIIMLQNSCEEKHQKDIHNMEHKYMAKIEDLEDKHKDEMKKLQEQYEAKLTNLQTSQKTSSDKQPTDKQPIKVEEEIMMTAESVQLQASAPISHDTTEQQRTLTTGDASSHLDSTTLEGENIVKMLNSDLDNISAESTVILSLEKFTQTETDVDREDTSLRYWRDTLQKMNDRLLVLLSDSVKTSFCIEETINRHLGKIVKPPSDTRPGSAAALRDESNSRPSSGSSGRGSKSVHQRASSVQRSIDEEARSATPTLIEPEERSQDSDTFQETSIVSVTSDEGLDLSQRISGNLFTGPDLDAEGEEIINDASQRLHAAVQRLLEMIEQSTNQLMSVKSMHQELLDVLAESNEEIEILKSKNQETEERLKEQIQAKEFLALELNKAEGLVEGYSAEREEMIHKINDLEEQREVLVMDLETTRNQLRDYQSSHHEIEAVKTEVQRQQSILHDNAGQELQVSTTTEVSPPSRSYEGLMLEVTRLNEVKRDLDQQMKDLQSKYEMRISDLENVGDDTEKHYSTLLEEYKQQCEDLQLQLESTEKQLKANKQFLEELTNEREQEREDFMKEIEKWKKILQEKEKEENAQDRLQKEVQELSDQLHNKTKTCSEILEATEKLKRELNDKEFTEQDLKELVKQLEVELDEKNKSERQLKQKIMKLEGDIEKLQHMGDDLALSIRSASEHSGRESPVIDEQVVQAAVANVVQSQFSLDEELRQTNENDHDLVFQKNALQNQVQEQLVQISALKNQLDYFRHRGDTVDAFNMAGYQEQLQELREQLDKAEQEVSRLGEINEELKKDIGYRDAQVQKLESQRQLSGIKHQLDQPDIVPQDPDIELQDEIKRLKAEVEQKDKLLNEHRQAFILDHSQLSDYSLTDTDRDKLRLSLEAGANLQQEIGEAITQKVESELASLKHENQHLKDVLKELEEGKAKQGADNSARSELSASQCGGETGALSDVLHDKEVIIEHLTEQLDSLETEVDSLNEFQAKLQDDFDTVQGMLEEKQKEVDTLEKELIESKADKEIMEKYEVEIKTLQKQLTEKNNTIEENAEELYMLNEKVEKLEDILKSQDAKDKDESNVQSVTKLLDDAESKNKELESKLELILQDLEKAETKNQHLESEVTQVQYELEMAQQQAEDENEEVFEQLDQTRAELNEKEKLLVKFEKELEEKSSLDISSLQDRDQQIKGLQEALENLQQKMAAGSQNKDTDDSEREKNKLLVVQLEEKLENLEKELLCSHEALEESTFKLKDREEDLKKMRDEFEKSVRDESKNRDLMGQVGELENIVSLQKKQLEEKNLYIHDLQLEVQNFQKEDIAKDIQKLQTTAGAAEDEAAKTEEHIQHLRQDLLTAKTAVQQMQQESGDNLEYSLRSKSSSTESLDSVQMRDELKRTRQQLREIKVREASTMSMPDMSHEMSRLNKELERTLAELELYRSSASMQAKDFVKKVSELKKELTLENERHIRNIESRSDEDIASQFARLQLRHEEEVRDLRQEHKRQLQAEVNEAKTSVEKYYKTEINKLMSQQQRQIDRMRVGAGADDLSLSDSDQSEMYSSVPNYSHSMRRQDGVGQEISSSSSITDIDTASKQQSLFQRLHNEGVQMLTLSELQYLHNQSIHGTDGKDVDFDALKAAWDNEKQMLLSSNQSLKDLMSVIQTSQTLEKTSEVAISDWRSELIRALAMVFSKERDVLLAELRSYVSSHPNDDITPVQILEKKIKNQATHQSDSLEQLMSAERQSMLNEIRDLRANANVSRSHTDDLSQQLEDKLNSAEDEWSKQEMKLKRQIQLLEYKLQQQEVIYEDSKTSMELTRSRLTEVTSQLSREKSQTIELQTENANLEVMISKIKGTLEREQSRYLSLSTAFEEEQRKNVHLGDVLDNEKSKHRQVKTELQNLKSHSEQTGTEKEQVTYELQAVVAKEREGRIQASGQVEQAKIKINLLQQELEAQKRVMLERDTENETRFSHLQSQLEAEKQMKDEINRKLMKSKEKERELSEKLKEYDENARSDPNVNAMEQVRIEELEDLLRSERNKVSNMQNSLEREKHRLATVTTAMETEKSRYQEEIVQERSTCRQIKKELDLVQMQKLDITRHYEREKELVNKFKLEQNKLQDELKFLKERENRGEKDRDGERINERKAMRQLERERDEVKMQLHEQELEGQRLIQKIHELEDDIEEFRRKDLQAYSSIDKDRIVPSHFSKYESPRSRSRSPAVSRDQTDGNNSIEDIRQRLLYLILKSQEELSKTQGLRDSSSSGGLDNSFVSRINEVINELQQLKIPLHSEIQEETSLQYSSPGNMSQVNGRILSHNAELTNFVSRLTREKLELRNRIMQLEEEIVRERQKGTLNQDRGRRPFLNSEMDHESELLIKRTEWSREKLSLQLALNESEKEIERLQRQLRLSRDRRSEVDVSSSSDSDLDTDKMQRLYGKYLRAESFRKNLMYQKKYLLILLGGYEESECETLAMIARMGVYPRSRDVQRRSRHMRPFSLFRSAARVVIAIFRMKYLSKKWRCARRVGSPVAATNMHLPHGYVPQSNGFSPSRQVTSSVLPDYSSHHQPVSQRLHSDLPASVSVRTRSSYHSPHSMSNQSNFYTPPTHDRDSIFVTPVEARSSSVRRNLMTDLSLPQNGANYLSNGDHTLHDDYILRLENLQHRLQDFRSGHRSNSYSSVRPRK